MLLEKTIHTLMERQPGTAGKDMCLTHVRTYSSALDEVHLTQIITPNVPSASLRLTSRSSKLPACPPSFERQGLALDQALPPQLQSYPQEGSSAPPRYSEAAGVLKKLAF